MRLKIKGFTDVSALEQADAQFGDLILKYDGRDVHNLNELGEAQANVSENQVSVELKRGNEFITVQIPSGALGVYLQELQPAHQIKDDPVIIKGVEKLEWDSEMKNTFLGCMTRIEEKFGQKLDYNQLAGLSTYAFRFHFFDRWCPSSPDATVGFDAGSYLLDQLGYEYEMCFKETDQSKESGIKTYGEEELKAKIKESIDKGWPVMAADLIQVPEWGIITGYQDDGNEHFCRTYFDKTEGYELAQKFPFLVLIIKDKKEVEIDHTKVLPKVHELYTTEKYDNYFSGIKAWKEWIAALEDEEFFKDLTEDKHFEVMHTNWWIYYTLTEARLVALDYFHDYAGEMGIDEEDAEQLYEILSECVAALESGLPTVPSPYEQDDPEWEQEQRVHQVKILKQILEIEEEFSNNLADAIKKD